MSEPRVWSWIVVDAMPYVYVHQEITFLDGIMYLYQQGFG